MAVNVTFIDLNSSFTCHVRNKVPSLKESIILYYTDIIMTLQCTTYLGQ